MSRHVLTAHLPTLFTLHSPARHQTVTTYWLIPHSQNSHVTPSSHPIKFFGNPCSLASPRVGYTSSPTLATPPDLMITQPTPDPSNRILYILSTVLSSEYRRVLVTRCLRHHTTPLCPTQVTTTGLFLHRTSRHVFYSPVSQHTSRPTFTHTTLTFIFQ